MMIFLFVKRSSRWLQHKHNVIQDVERATEVPFAQVGQPSEVLHLEASRGKNVEHKTLDLFFK